MNTHIIKKLNDNFRRSLSGGRLMLSAGVSAMPYDESLHIVNMVRIFKDFNKDNDPYNEHDFGSLICNNKKIFWKIDYYDKSLKYGSENPANPGLTTRVLTIMLAEEY